MTFLFSLLFSLNLLAANPVVVIETSSGEIEVELFQKEAPVTVANFLKHVDSKFYDGTIFHRVIDNFMIQGGGFTPDMKEKPTIGTIKNEADNGLKNMKGTIAMARTPDPHSASVQFFINVADNNFLDHKDKTNQGYGYAVFGKVVSGIFILDRIKSVKTGTIAGHSDVPMDKVVIKSIKRK